MNGINWRKAAIIALSIGLSICCGCSLTENEYDEPEEKVSVFQKDATTNYVLVTAAGADQIGSWGGGYEYELYALLANYGQEKEYAAQGDISDFVEGKIAVASAMTYNEMGLLLNDYEGAYDMEESISCIDMNDEGVGMLQDGICCSEEFLWNNPNTAAAFLDASIRGWEYACSHPDEAAIITNKYSNGISRDHQIYMAHEVKKLVENGIDGDPVKQIGEMYPGSMQQTLELCKRYIIMREEEQTVRLRKLKLADVRKTAVFDMAMNDSYDEPEKREVTLRLAWDAQAQFMGFFVALEKGWYEDVGLDVTVMEGNDGQDTMKLLEEGTADFGVAALYNVIEAKGEGRKVVEIAQLFQRSALNLVYRTEEEENLLRVGVNPHTYGFALQDSVTGEYSGLEVDIARKLAEKLGYEGVKFVNLDEAHRIPYVQDGKVEIVISTLTITEERRKLVDFSPSYYSDKVSVLVSEGGGIASLEDLPGKTIGVVEGSNSGKCLVEAMIERGLIAGDSYDPSSYTDSDFDGGIIFNIYADYASSAEALERGDIDGAAGDRSLLNSYCCRGYHYIDEAFAPQDYGIAMKKGGTLSEKVTAILEEWKNDGTLDKMKEEWGL